MIELHGLHGIMIRKLKSGINTVKIFFWEKIYPIVSPIHCSTLRSILWSLTDTPLAVHPLNLMEDQFLQKAVG